MNLSSNNIGQNTAPSRNDAPVPDTYMSDPSAPSAISAGHRPGKKHVVDLNDRETSTGKLANLRVDNSGESSDSPIPWSFGFGGSEGSVLYHAGSPSADASLDHQQFCSPRGEDLSFGSSFDNSLDDMNLKDDNNY